MNLSDNSVNLYDFAMVLLFITVGETVGLPKKRKNFAKETGDSRIAPMDRRCNLLFCAKGGHLIHHYRGPPSPQGKAYEKSGNLTATHIFH